MSRPRVCTACGGSGSVWFRKVGLQARLDLLERVLGEYVQGNQIIDGYWYSPDETGAPHYRNDRATADELALVESLTTEAGL